MQFHNFVNCWKSWITVQHRNWLLRAQSNCLVHNWACMRAIPALAAAFQIIVNVSFEVWGWAEKFIGSLWLVKFNQMWFIFQNSLPCGPHTSSIGVAALGFPWYKSFHPDLQKGFHVGEQKIIRWCQLWRIWRVINQCKATVTHSSLCNHRLVCRSIVLVKLDSLCQFSRPFWNLSSTTFQSPEFLIQCGFIWKKKIQYLERLDLTKPCLCQVSLLWSHNFVFFTFSVSLWTFQPTHVGKENRCMMMNFSDTQENRSIPIPCALARM